MSPTEISTLLDSLNAEVNLHRRPESYVDQDRRWSCNITLSSSGTEIKVRAEAGSMDAAMSVAYDKLAPLVKAPAVAHALALPLLGAPVIEAEVIADPGI